ncbi:ATP-binding protein [Streptomyces cyaneofuscatus]|uniref:ATP-binding protein n=1 Tax=Streptomyces cyaneofuscatus TaxID=66883 RepID=UPI00332D5A52
MTYASHDSQLMLVCPHTCGTKFLLRPDEARALTRRLLEDIDPPASGHAVSDAVLVTHELVTNAIRHGGGLVAFSVTVDADTIRVSVADHSVALPVTPRPVEPGEGGYGWAMVCTLTDTRGVTVSARGKTIAVCISLR